MAEYYISYKDVVSLIDTWIESAPKSDLTKRYKSEILAAITCNLDVNETSASSIVSWWKNTISEPSQLLLKTKYISIGDVMKIFLEEIISSGALEDIIANIIAENPLSISMSVSTNILTAIYKLIKSINSLEDDDFCIFLQARMHLREHKSFTKEDLIEWLPQKECMCNAHDSRWDCMYCDNEKCQIHNHIDEALTSLIDKQILKYDKKTKEYKFKW